MSESSSEEEEFTGDVEEPEEEESEAEEDEDEEELEVPTKRNDDGKPFNNRHASRGAAAPISYAEENDDDDSSDDDGDDVPLSSLVQKKKPSPKKKSPSKTKANGKTKKAAAPPAKKQKTASKATSTTSNNGSSSSKTYEYASAALYGTESTKGLLLQRLLCRWWYAIEWPDPSKLRAQPPKHYDALDGFPGVFICTSADGDEAVGHIRDERGDHDRPCFKTFCRKPSSELQQLLIKALTEQTKQLVAAKGKGTATENELQTLIKWAQKVNPAKADKEAETVLKAHRLELP